MERWNHKTGERRVDLPLARDGETGLWESANAASSSFHSVDDSEDSTIPGARWRACLHVQLNYQIQKYGVLPSESFGGRWDASSAGIAIFIGSQPSEVTQRRHISKGNWPKRA
ncbi:hypothetical protein BofuT4_P124610.1 [Botrytis cinerea T4]|uniref:Uncharacterized protein n=1 Tax=Botryotinia fuckeliana (strain T4) TaxID=999810 RepID=G2YS15_BOTF4|nr:hypothetical protein BofuT4_P124610.1 [Botrytis cinerea T4]